MTNREVAKTLDYIADILQIKDDNPFKVKAYRQAANSIYHLDEDIHYLYDKGRLGDIHGVGQAIQSKIEELVEKGSCEYYENLLEEVPRGVLDMLSIPGIGHKTVKIVYEKLGVRNLEELLHAAQEHRVRTLPGMGGKNEYAIIKGIEMLKQNSDKNTLGIVLPMAEKLLAYLMGCDQVKNASLAGSIRRGKPLVSDIDILVAAEDESGVRSKVTNYREVKQVANSEVGHIEGTLEFDIPFEVIIVSIAEYYPALLWTTGSREHLKHLLNGRDRDFIKDCGNESEVYERFHLDYIPPELREDKGEIEAATQGSLPQLIDLGDIQGDLHVHSTWSDGASKIKEMAEMARSLNYSYLAITDHSRSLPISGGLNEERLKSQGEEIDQINGLGEDIKILKGTEVDILKDGSLDFGSEVLRDLDIVVGSIHSHFKLDKEKQTERVVRAIKDEDVDIIGHLSGRLLNRRPAYELDFDQILEEAAKNRVILEINSHPDRLDIDADLARRARDYDIKIAINSDAHHKNDLKLIKYGILNARRGWLEKKDIINTWTLDEINAYIR
ncbi:MAG: DNA polymerase/3'-5' exonuclease PolX [Firmicutes bacterium HGW-Firmicutes-15]|nr:MAG: DNA polymerase/3'-5' exonuclease PolX [Firmicutes bacterium HGW-Firmicutes-15]